MKEGNKSEVKHINGIANVAAFLLFLFFAALAAKEKSLAKRDRRRIQLTAWRPQSDMAQTAR